jgi:hypothetical protein
VGEQTSQITAQLDELLAAAGSHKTRLLSASIWLTDISTFSEMNAVWDSWVPADMGPARLGWPDVPLAREMDTLHLPNGYPIGFGVDQNTVIIVDKDDPSHAIVRGQAGVTICNASTLIAPDCT